MEVPMNNRMSRSAKYLALVLLAATLIISVGGSVLLIQHWEYISRLQSRGYLGLFVISIFAGSPIPIPTPSMILTFTLGSILSPFWVGLVSGYGNALGNALIFWTGRGGHKAFQKLMVSDPSSPPRSKLGRFIRKLSRVPEIAGRRVLVAIFVLSIYPNPILTPLILGMGATRFRFWKFFFTIWAGKTAQSMILSYLGYFGLRSLLRLFGILTVPL
jgi:membrane protein YqaA with SNARE-associated domain